MTTATAEKKPTAYKWVALSNTTLGILMATVNSSIVIISLPAIFRGVALNPLEASNVSYLLWMLMGYLLVSAVLVVSLGRLGDIYGRVRIYNAGFLVFSLASVFLAVDPLTGGAGALWLIGGRVIQGVGGAMLMANSSAIVTDAFPSNQRGLALGINMVAGLSGSFIGLVAGGLLSEVDWRLVFWFSVPFGLLGTFWAYRSLQEIGAKNPSRIDWWGNLTFAVGLSALLSGITYGIQPYGGHTMGWTNPWVEAGLIGGALMLGVFCFVETKVAAPMFHLDLFKVRAFAAGNSVTFLSSIARGGLQFMLIIWLQGIWLPLHGYSYENTPLWAGIYLVPLTIGFLIAGPLSGYLSDKFGARAFASGGLLLVAVTFGGLLLLPTDFAYGWFALLIGLNGFGSGLFAAPNTAAVMNSVPAAQRGAANGMMSTFQNSGMVLSIGIFFSLMVVGLASKLPSTMAAGLTANGVPSSAAHQIANQPPVGDLFASFLGFNPLGTLLTQAHVTGLTVAQHATLTGKEFFPHLIAQPFHHGLEIVFTLAIVMSLVSAGVSLLRGQHYVHDDAAAAATEPAPEAAGDLFLESADSAQS